MQRVELRKLHLMLRNGDQADGVTHMRDGPSNKAARFADQQPILRAKECLKFSCDSSRQKSSLPNKCPSFA